MYEPGDVLTVECDGQRRRWTVMTSAHYDTLVLVLEPVPEDTPCCDGSENRWRPETWCGCHE